jgi:CRISPR-associated protein Csd1
MILQALNDYYGRLAEDEDSGVPLRGFSRQPVPFALEIAADGTLKQVLDLRVQDGRKLVAPQLVVPEPLKLPGSGFSANFLWDNTGYVLGADTRDNPERAKQALESFKTRLEEVAGQVEDEGVHAVSLFFSTWSPDQALTLNYWKDMAGLNLVFRLVGERRFVHERPKVCKAWLTYYEGAASAYSGQCLITGQEGPIALTHPRIKGVWRAQTSGAALVSFNLRAFESYGKDHLQGLNAPVSEAAAFNYTTALNDLLRRDSRQKVQIGDATTVFWTKRKTASEGIFGMVLNPGPDPGEQQRVHAFLDALRQGKWEEEYTRDKDVHVYVLGLSPNASRLSVRFWHVDTVEGLWAKIRQHFDDLDIVKRDNEPDFPPQWLLLKAAAKREDLDNLSPLLSGALMRSILTGNAYPGALLAAVMGRIRAEQKITYARAALVKACLVRNARLHGQTPEVSVSLDEQSTNVPYRLGRLFAVLEKLQQEAIPGANTTIKDRYFGSASATPRSVFPVLLRLSQHHVSKIEYGLVHDKRIAAILDGVDIADGGFPAHLKLEDQGLFALGYYHQRTSLWTKKAAAAPETANTAPTED